MEDVARCGYIFFFNFFQRVCGHPLKEVKAFGGCYGIRKECFAGQSTMQIPENYAGV